MKTVALIPIRAGSKGVPNKNWKDMCGKPLCHWVIDAAFGARSVDEVWVSTDNLGWDHDLVLLLERPGWLATDTASSDDVLRHFCWSQCEPDDRVVMLQATSPLTTPEDIDNAVRFHGDIGGLTTYASRDRTVVSVVEMPQRLYWSDCHPNYNPIHRPMRERISETYMENGAIYCTGASRIMEGGARITDHAIPYVMPEDTKHEIDTPEDWDIVEKLLEARLS